MTLAEIIDIDPDRLAASCERFGVARLDVFGTVARGESNAGSDLDLLYELRPGARLGWEIEDLVEELEELFGRTVDLVSRRGLHPRLRAVVLADAPSTEVRRDVQPDDVAVVRPRGDRQLRAHPVDPPIEELADGLTRRGDVTPPLHPGEGVVERGLCVLLGEEAADLLLATLPVGRETEVEPIAPSPSTGLPSSG